MMYFVFQSYRTVDLVPTKGVFSRRNRQKENEKTTNPECQTGFSVVRKLEVDRIYIQTSAKICVSFQTNHYEG